MSYFRPLLRFGAVTSDAADIMLFRSRLVQQYPVTSDTWRAAYGIFGVSSLIAMHSDAIPLPLAALVAVIGMVVLWAWAHQSTEDARRSYLVLAAGTFVQFLSVLSTPIEIVMSIWFVLAFMHAMRPR